MSSGSSGRPPRRDTLATLPLIGLAVLLAPSAAAGQLRAPDSTGICPVAGVVRSGEATLPGVWLVAERADVEERVATTTSRRDGGFELSLPAGASYRLTGELAGFARMVLDITVPEGPCGRAVTLDARMALLPEDAVVSAAVGSSIQAPAVDPDRVEALSWEFPAIATQMGLPFGFWTEDPPAALVVLGEAMTIDRARMRSRLQAVARGEIVLPLAVDDDTSATAAGGAGTTPASASTGSPTGGERAADGRIGATAGGRVVAPQRNYQATLDYTLRGSMLESPPYQLRPERAADKRPYTRQTFGITVGGPVRIPALYDGGRRTAFTLTYGGDRGSNLFDQYSTVPSLEMRAGDFSSVPLPLVDPLTGVPFPGNQIPESRMHAGTLTLMRFIPLPNLPGTSRNFQYTTTRASVTDNVSLRVTHQFGALPPARGASRGAGGAPAEAAARPLSANLNAQVQVRRSDAEQVNAFPDLGGSTHGTTLTIPVTLNVQAGSDVHALTANLSRTTTHAGSRYAFLENVAELAGIRGVADMPFAWGVPALTFSTFSSVRDVNPSLRRDHRLTLQYAWTRPIGGHTVKAGAESRLDRSSNVTDSNARGTFVFTGHYVADGRRLPRGTGADFADFLLGLPQEASVQYGPGEVRMRGRSLSLYVQDDWRRSAALTLNLGLRYEMVWPFFEARGQMVNLDVSPGFDAVAPVVAGEEGPYSGIFPRGMVRADTNNLAPRLGLAWRAPRAITVRSGYTASFDSGTYSSMARRLVGQPPFAATQASRGSLGDPLDLGDPFADAALVPTANTFGVNREYALGIVHTWNADLSRPFRTVWTASGSYTGKRGSSLDIIRAPNRDPRAQGFQWQSSEGRSLMHGATFRMQRRKANGWSTTVTYTLARARDNVSSMGGGGTAVAQDDEDLDAEWGFSSNDRRHQFSVNGAIDLPFGSGRRWHNAGGMVAALLDGWTATATLTAQSGTPLTPRVTGAQAANRTLRADYDGGRITLPSPSIDLFFNTAAFSVPDRGLLGTAGRNIIPGPGSTLLNATIARDLKVGGPRVLTVRLAADNLLNRVNYNAVNTVVNSSSFGQVTSVRPMRTMTLNLKLTL